MFVVVPMTAFPLRFFVIVCERLRVLVSIIHSRACLRVCVVECCHASARDVMPVSLDLPLPGRVHSFPTSLGVCIASLMPQPADLCVCILVLLPPSACIIVLIAPSVCVFIVVRNLVRTHVCLAVSISPRVCVVVLATV
jgi:hypothetical protein